VAATPAAAAPSSVTLEQALTEVWRLHPGANIKTFWDEALTREGPRVEFFLEVLNSAAPPLRDEYFNGDTRVTTFKALVDRVRFIVEDLPYYNPSAGGAASLYFRFRASDVENRHILACPSSGELYYQNTETKATHPVAHGLWIQDMAGCAHQIQSYAALWRQYRDHQRPVGPARVMAMGERCPYDVQPSDVYKNPNEKGVLGHVTAYARFNGDDGSIRPVQLNSDSTAETYRVICKSTTLDEFFT
jgi:hypothetical protein